MSIRLMSPHSCEERSEVGSSVSVSSFRSKYEPQRSLHEQVADVFSRPVRRVPSRGHEIPEPLMCPSPHRRPHTSGTKLPPCFSPIRPSERSRKLYSRATSPVMLRHGRHIPVDMISVKYKYPLNQIAYERPSTLASSLHNASLPSGAESILEETRFQSIAPFSKKEFYQSMSAQQQHELAQRRRRKRIVTKTFPVTQAPFVLDYEKRGTKGAAKRHVHKLYM
mmetsp:Transcript_23406/g.34343  ORF Transcript_23406/g.34343 Transcript_23406/m.34343 type:complete len:223 (-) Transcript_23406:177-845(-)|eukprot:CAMPEP_0185020328 /NCGR_PEP_ID=MMETSP1103-20130426/2923_1 /TAXON_ID=36769 /ORGANISM="Paraphysomonas bandaiensis, Strain Caron Lab Isolate" /LENGTH=222 /DNA_ID=CAMNT_0027551159 /DNA_START=26 /DNA_END=694 /DNA_ORIENTATION=-